MLQPAAMSESSEYIDEILFVEMPKRASPTTAFLRRAS